MQYTYLDIQTYQNDKLSIESQIMLKQEIEFGLEFAVNGMYRGVESLPVALLVLFAHICGLCSAA